MAPDGKKADANVDAGGAPAPNSCDPPDVPASTGAAGGGRGEDGGTGTPPITPRYPDDGYSSAGGDVTSSGSLCGATGPGQAGSYGAKGPSGAGAQVVGHVMDDGSRSPGRPVAPAALGKAAAVAQGKIAVSGDAVAREVVEGTEAPRGKVAVHQSRCSSSRRK